MALPVFIQSEIEAGALFVVNRSGGKDMAAVVRNYRVSPKFTEFEYRARSDYDPYLDRPVQVLLDALEGIKSDQGLMMPLARAK